ncbi:isocitrate lyase/phosphoenolpyruvate mutase family protein [Streptomyces sp. NPDC059506]|uniref:isocitrate lyase/PEP mutase family protein n=1 Tax=Streptomyces sp. NPDC059506 TaxID=3347751 RepID=UPI0036C05138
MTDHLARQQSKARTFRSLHRSGEPLVLANAWDAVSARIVEEAGAAAVATTSAAVAWSLGTPDGDALDRDSALARTARVVAAVDLPVTADIESGFAADAEGVAETVRGVLAAGAVGINLEDALYGGPAPLRPVEEQAERIAAARGAADAGQVPLFVNARTDVFLRAVGDPRDRLKEALARAEAFLEAGADGIFVPGVTDPGTVSELAAALGAPLNVLAGPGAPTVSELAACGAARVSLGSGVARAAYTLVGRSVREVLTDGTYTELDGALGHEEVNALLEARKP